MVAFNSIKPSPLGFNGISYFVYQYLVDRVKMYLFLYVDAGESEEVSPPAPPLPPTPEPTVSLPLPMPLPLPPNQPERVEEPERATAPEIRATAASLHSALPISIPQSTNTLNTLTGKS